MGRRRVRMRASGPAWLVALSLGLLVAGVGAYGASLPLLLSQLPEGAAPEEGVAGAAEVAPEQAPDGEKDADAAGATAQAPDGGTQTDAAGSADPVDPSADAAAPGDNAAGEDAPDDGDASDAPGAGAGTGDAPAPSDPDGRGPSSPEKPSDPEKPSQPAEPSRPSTSDDPLNGYPTEAEEQATHARFSAKANAASGFVTKANAVASAFASDASSASLDARLSRQRTCTALSSQLWSEYYSVRDTPLTNRSRYKKAQENLIGMYRCLAQYVDTYGSAWELNVAFEDPAGHEADYMGPINSNGAGSQNRYLKEYYTWQGGLSL